MSRRVAMLMEHEPRERVWRLDTMQEIFQKAIAAILGSQGINLTREAYEYICMLAEEHLLELCTRLHKVSGIQRRRSPSIGDVAMLLRFTGIRIHDLERQMHVSSRYIDLLNQLQVDPTEEPVPEAAKPFFDVPAHSSNKLVPNRKTPGDHVPSWLPSYPSDHTFMATPQYTDRITDPRQLREKIVEEGRLAEAALRRLTETVRVGDENLLEDEDEEMKEEEDEEEELVEVELDEQQQPKNNNDDDHDRKESTNDPEMKEEESNELKKEEDEEAPPVMSLPSATSSTPNVAVSTPPPPQSDTTTTTDNNVAEEKPKKLSLKISLGGNVIKATTGSGGTTTTTMTASERNKYDPFEIRTTSKRFDVVEYARKRKEINERRDRKQKQLKEERKQEELPDENNTTTQLTGADLIDHEFNSAFASVQRKHSQNGSETQGVRDSGIVNWDKKRYI
jgi:hypothetical protein